MEFICFINIFYRYGKKLLEDMLSKKDITMQELIVLLVIDKSKGIYQHKLIDFTGLDKSNLSKFLKKLEDKNYVIRQASKENPSQKECYLSPYGKSLIPYLEETINSWLELMKGELSDKDFALYKDMSYKISDNLFNNLNKRW